MLVLDPKKRSKIDELFEDDYIKEAEMNLNHTANYLQIV